MAYTTTNKQQQHYSFNLSVHLSATGPGVKIQLDRNAFVSSTVVDSIDFYSPVLLSYVLTWLCDNYALFRKHWTDRLETKHVKGKLLDLISLYVPDVTQQHLNLAKLTT